MSKAQYLGWSIVLSVPVQYFCLLIPLLYEFYTVGVVHSGGTGDYGCTNYHERGLSPCSLGAMLANPILGIVLFNALSMGLFWLLFIGVSAVLLGIGRAVYLKVSAGIA